MNIDNVLYRTKTTIKEYRNRNNEPYSYQVTEVEAPISGSYANDALSSSTSISCAKLLEGVEKSYDKGKKLLDESKVQFSVTPAQDAEYMEAIKAGDTDKAQRMVDEVAKTVGYKQGSQYQGGSAFNGVAPTGHEYYSTPEESLKAWENGEYEGSWSIADEFVRGIEMGDLSNRITANAYARGNRAQKESIQALRYVREKIQNGDKNPTVKVYRSVPKGIKEGSFRNGDWVTLSKSYAIENAEIHSGSQYYGKDGMVDWDNDGYNIIEMEVPIEELWWDGNDINEFGYDDGKEYRYKNTSNNRKLDEVVTYDDNGNIIPLSERFNENNSASGSASPTLILMRMTIMKLFIFLQMSMLSLCH